MRQPTGRRPLRAALALAAALMTALAASSPPATAAPGRGAPTFHAWNTPHALAAGALTGGARIATGPGGGVTLRPGASQGGWTSPVWYSPAPIRRLTPSWQANTPPGAWIEVKLSVLRSGRWSGWYLMGRWAFDQATVERASVPGQADADGSITVDTYRANPFAGPPTGYRLRVELRADPDAQGPPLLRGVAASTADPGPPPSHVSQPASRRPVDLAVPGFSQQTHRGEYPAYDRGGEAWCSPTSVAMVLAYWRVGPTRRELATLGPDPVFDAHGRADAVVDWAAAHTYDFAYHGAGNWSFNTAYAAAYGLDATVRHLTSLREVEAWVRRGVPVVVSIAWDNTDANPANDLAGAPLGRSRGHLLVVRGFTARGDVLVNDPAAPDNAHVRRGYDRAQFERDWLAASGGAAYIIKPPAVAG